MEQGANQKEQEDEQPNRHKTGPTEEDDDSTINRFQQGEKEVGPNLDSAPTAPSHQNYMQTAGMSEETRKQQSSGDNHVSSPIFPSEKFAPPSDNTTQNGNKQSAEEGGQKQPHPQPLVGYAGIVGVWRLPRQLESSLSCVPSMSLPLSSYQKLGPLKTR
ncbi:hypothetical protein SESBI_34849 [Sesbania bispinosa]|nr:hypothetical protein SESBI_34849 [Sesbania bispinosa]